MARPRPHRGSTLSRLGVTATAALALLLGTATAASAAEFHGTQLSPYWSGESAAEVDRQLDLARDSGANVIRVNLSWSSLQEKGPNKYSSWYVAKADRLFEHAHQRGLEVIPNLWSAPCWATSAPSRLVDGCEGDWWSRGITKYPPTNVDDYAAVAAFSARRWGRYMAGLQIWNEPNHTFWVSSHQAADYARLVKAAYPAIKAADPGVSVVAGGLSGADGQFLEDLYANGIRGYFDAFSIHPYSNNRSPAATATGEARRWSMASGVPWMRQIMLDHGDSRPMWLSEYGWTTCQDFTEKCVSATRQAEYTAEAWRVIDRFGYVLGATQYQLRDNGTDRRSLEDNYGLVNHDYSVKPAYAAFRAAQGAPPERPFALRIGEVRLTRMLARGIELRVRCSSVCRPTVSVRLRHGRLIARRTFGGQAAERDVVLRVPLSLGMKRAIRSARGGVRLLITLRAPGGESRSVVLRRSLVTSAERTSTGPGFARTAGPPPGRCTHSRQVFPCPRPAAEAGA